MSEACVKVNPLCRGGRLTFDPRPTDLLPAVVVAVDEPADGGLRRLGDALQEGGVVAHAVLRYLHRVAVS